MQMYIVIFLLTCCFRVILFYGIRKGSSSPWSSVKSTWCCESWNSWEEEIYPTPREESDPVHFPHSCWFAMCTDGKVSSTRRKRLLERDVNMSDKKKIWWMMDWSLAALMMLQKKVRKCSMRKRLAQILWHSLSKDWRTGMDWIREK